MIRDYDGPLAIARDLMVINVTKKTMSCGFRVTASLVDEFQTWIGISMV